MPKQNDKEQKEGLKTAESKTSLFGGLFGGAEKKGGEKALSENKEETNATKKDVLKTETKEEETSKKLKGSSLIDKKNMEKERKSFFGSLFKKIPKTDEVIKQGDKVAKEKSLEQKESEKTKSEPKREIVLDAKKKTEGNPSPKSMLSNLFKKSESKTEESPSSKEEKKEEPGKKNLFVDLFPQEAKKNEDDSLIETIVEQSDKPPSILGQKLRDKRKEAEKDNKKEKKEEKDDLLFWSYISLVVSFIVPLIIYTFFYFHITPESKLIDLIGVQNTGMLYQEKIAERDALIKKIADKKVAITKLEETSKQSLMEKTIKQIQAGTNDWLLVMDYIKDVTNEGVRYNDLLKRVIYNSYNFNGKENEITLNAKIFDPNKQVFTLATSLIDAVNESEYFSGLENRNFAKSISEEGAEMSLTMNFNYIPESGRENLTTVLD